MYTCYKNRMFVFGEVPSPPFSCHLGSYLNGYSLYIKLYHTRYSSIAFLVG